MGFPWSPQRAIKQRKHHSLYCHSPYINHLVISCTIRMYSNKLYLKTTKSYCHRFKIYQQVIIVWISSFWHTDNQIYYHAALFTSCFATSPSDVRCVSITHKNKSLLVSVTSRIFVRNARAFCPYLWLCVVPATYNNIQER